MHRLFHRASSHLRSLPSTPGSPSIPHHHSNTTPTDTPTGNHTPPGNHDRTLPTESSITEDSDTDYSDLEEGTPIKTVPAKATPTITTPPKGTYTRPNTDMDDAVVLVSAASQFTPPKLPATHPTTSNGVVRWRQSSESPCLTSHQRELQSSGSSSASSESHEGSYQVRQGSQYPPPGADQGSRFRIQHIPSSEKLASTLRQMIPKRNTPPSNSHLTNAMSAHPEGTPSPPTAWRPAQHNGTEVSSSPHHLTKISEVTTPPIPIPTSNNNSATPLLPAMPLLPDSGDTTSMAMQAKRNVSHGNTWEGPRGKTSDIIPIRRGRSSTCRQGDSGSSEYFSSDTIPTDTESSLEVFSHMSSSPTASMLRSQSASNTRVAGKNKAAFENRKSAMVASDIIEEEGDQLNPLEGFKSDMRSRTKTLSSRQEFSGRVKLKQHRMEMKRVSSISTSIGISKGMPEPTMKQLELLSPELLERIRGMTRNRIYSTYGGKKAVMGAVGVIEEAYRAYRLRRRFLERKKEKREDRTMQRKRALSMRQPNRRPTMMTGRKYVRKEQQRPQTTKKDPILKYKEMAERLTKERLPHAHSGSRLELMESKRGVAANPLVEGVRGEEKEKVKMLVSYCQYNYSVTGSVYYYTHGQYTTVYRVTCYHNSLLPFAEVLAK